MFFPKRTKYRKYRKGSIKGFELKNKDLKFGFYGLKSLESGRITAKQIETVRQAVQRKIKPYGKIWV
jgi:large subunit ribosomal protein L16